MAVEAPHAAARADTYGNTSIAIFKRGVEDPQLLVDVSLVPEQIQLACGATPGPEA